MCRYRRELSNAYFLAKFRFGTAENEPCKACRIPRDRGCGPSHPSVAVGAPPALAAPAHVPLALGKALYSVEKDAFQEEMRLQIEVSYLQQIIAGG